MEGGDGGAVKPAEELFPVEGEIACLSFSPCVGGPDSVLSFSVSLPLLRTPYTCMGFGRVGYLNLSLEFELEIFFLLLNWDEFLYKYFSRSRCWINLINK